MEFRNQHWLPPPSTIDHGVDESDSETAPEVHSPRAPVREVANNGGASVVVWYSDNEIYNVPNEILQQMARSRRFGLVTLGRLLHEYHTVDAFGSEDPDVEDDLEFIQECIFREVGQMSDEDILRLIAPATNINEVFNGSYHQYRICPQ